MLLSIKVDDFLKEQRRGNNKKHAGKLVLILANIRRTGLPDVNNNTLFVREGRFPAGRAGVADMAVYAAKAFQLRIYGGLVRIGGQSVFLCPEAAVKKRDLADRAQLERVARILGEHHER